MLGDQQAEDIYKPAYIGHGDRGGTLAGISQPGSEGEFIVPGSYAKCGIAEMHLITCSSNEGA